MLTVRRNEPAAIRFPGEPSGARGVYPGIHWRRKRPDNRYRAVSGAHCGPARGGPPAAFALGYDPSKILPGCRYGLHASIRAGGKALFVGEPLALDDLDGSQISGVDLLVRRASGDGETLRPSG